MREMASAIAARQAVFFVGAGLSAMAGAPSWDKLIAPLRARLHPPTDERNPLLVAQFFANQYGSNALFEHVRDQIHDYTLMPTEAHRQLCSMPVSVFVTTNYDDLLELTLRDLQRPAHVTRDERSLAVWNEEQRVQVLKLHGDLSSPESIVLTDWDYVRFLCDRSLMKRKLSELFSYRTVIFVGYGLRDPNVSQTFNAISHELGGLKRQAYIVSFDDDKHQQNEWRRRGVQPVSPYDDPETAGMGKSAALAAFLTRLNQAVTATNRSIMIVDDDADLLRVWQRALQQAIDGADVRLSHDGYYAMYALGRVRPRVLIVDANMPQIDGRKLIEMVRQFPELDDTKIIALSGRPNAFEQHEMEELRVAQFLQKPFTNDQLVTRVAELLNVRTRNAQESDMLPRRPSGVSFFPPDPAIRLPREKKKR